MAFLFRHSKEGVTTIPKGSRAKRPEAHSPQTGGRDSLLSQETASSQRLVTVWRLRISDPQRTQSEELFDYDRELGVRASFIAGLKKTVYNSVDYGTIVIPTYAAPAS